MKKVTRAIIINGNHEVLLGKRARGNGAGLWALIGGKIEIGETPEECIIREVYEEIGVMFTPIKYNEEIDTDEFGAQWHVYYFVGKIDGEIALSEEENLAVSYFSNTDIRELSLAFGHEKKLQEFFEKTSPLDTSYIM
jgi:mutator protein MutT